MLVNHQARPIGRAISDTVSESADIGFIAGTSDGTGVKENEVRNDDCLGDERDNNNENSINNNNNSINSVNINSICGVARVNNQNYILINQSVEHRHFASARQLNSSDACIMNYATRTGTQVIVIPHLGEPLEQILQQQQMQQQQATQVNQQEQEK